MMWMIAGYEWKRLLRIRTIVLMLIVAPLVLIFILGSSLSSVFEGEKGNPPVVKVAIYQEDQGQIPDGFRSFLKSPEVKKNLNAVYVTSRPEVVERVKGGEADLGLVIPAGFGKKVESGEKADWEVILGRNRERNLFGRLMLDAFLDETNRMQALFTSLSPQQVQQAVEVFRPLSVDHTDGGSYVQSGSLKDPERSYTALQYYAATMLIMFILYTGLTAASSLIKERELHTLERLQTAPVSVASVIMGKMAGNGLLALFQALVIYLVTAYVYGVEWGKAPLLLAATILLTVIASMGMGFIAAGLFRDTKAVSALYGSFIGVMTFVGGGMSPHNEGVMTILQKGTVNYWASDSLHRIMQGGDVTAVLHNLVVLAGIAAVTIALSLVFYRRVGYHA